MPGLFVQQVRGRKPQMKRLPDETIVGRNPRRVSPEEDGLAFQSRFFKRLGNPRQLLDLLEYLPDVEYFAKDREGRFVAISRGMLRRIGASAEEEYLGIADSVIHPPSVARSIREDDLHVMRTGKPIVDRVEALFARTRAKDWFLTTKLPVYDAAGEVIGVMGFVRPYRPGTSSGVQDVQVQRVVAHIHEHYRERIPVSEYARIAHLSERQLNRRFQETFRMSLQEFIMRTRIQAASDDLLVTDKAVAEIAHEHGFYDQSSFTKHFRNHTGETPLAFRQYRRLSRELKRGRMAEAMASSAATGGPGT
ncbi:helix-turn-helix transcriptional regulator [Verrucomicrobium spinosum]|uniref:helix-turn-helix transcriptional regulator n=2 Tax=Verrucomicrobium spinosum TaxID=2736 RepID=UPI0001745ACB|nr:helix-turn-helix domain-containing protein [Verrucomicrobium spinosum]